MAEKKKNEWAEKLAYAPKNGYERLSAEEERAMHAYCEDYKDFLDHGKTERLCVEHCIELAEPRAASCPTRRAWRSRRATRSTITTGVKQLCLRSSASRTSATARTSARRTPTRPAWTSSPARSTRKPSWPIFKTHHYGGIRKYHWVTIPLELHGVVVRGDGSTVAVHIGADEGDPQFIINDLLPHLGREQGKKPLNEAIPSESLNLLVGGRPLAGRGRARTGSSCNVLKLLN